MYSITRWDPFRDMMVVRRSMDRLFDNYLRGENGEPTAWNLALDVTETPEAFVVKASLPGVKPEDVEVTYSEDVLTIKGELHSEEEKEDARWHLRERRYGSFARSITLPRNVQGNAIEASYDAGVLTLHLPKSEDVKPKRIAIRSGEQARMIEGKTADVASKN